MTSSTSQDCCDTENAGAIELKHSNSLKKCFSAILRGKHVSMELNVVRHILSKQFEIDFESLDPVLVDILPHLLVYHVKHWPDWQAPPQWFKENHDSCYDNFIRFLEGKLRKAIHELYNEIVQEQVLENFIVNNTTPKRVAPFSIEVTSNPGLLNTIVFTDINQGDIILKSHIPMLWLNSDLRYLTLKQILAWPHVGVHLFSPILNFSRRNLHEYRRYINFVQTPLPSSERDFIETINVISDNQGKRLCYTIDYLQELLMEFLSSLEHLFTIPIIQYNMTLYQVLIEEFLKDIEELKIFRNKKPSIASNTSVRFNIGGCAYFRNKKLHKKVYNSRLDIGYNEIVIPRMETSLDQIAFAPEIKTYLSRLRNLNPKYKQLPILPQIMFSCTFCNLNFETVKLLMNHFIRMHNMESPMMCVVCKNSFTVLELTRDRWKHGCCGRPRKTSRDHTP